MGFMKNMAIKKVTKKRVHALFSLTLSRMSGYVNSYDESKLIATLKSIYAENNSTQPIENTIEMNEIQYWVTNNIIYGVIAELAYDPTIGQPEDYELICEIINKYLPAFLDFESSLMADM